MSEHQALFLRKGLVATCAFAALLLLATFYSVVSGAVERAARQHLLAAEAVPHAPVAAPAKAAARNRALLARVDN